MKATLNGIVYDTDTAERLADVTHILDLFADGARQYVQSVYKNCDGRYFLRVETSDDDYVVPLTGAEADLRQMDRCTGGACAQKHGRNFDVNKSKQTTGRLRPEFWRKKPGAFRSRFSLLLCNH